MLSNFNVSCDRTVKKQFKASDIVTKPFKQVSDKRKEENLICI